VRALAYGLQVNSHCGGGKGLIFSVRAQSVS
jgi:hypothetical protein